MTRPLTLGLLLLSSSFAFASTLAVYQDKSLYTYTQENTYLGMTRNVSLPNVTVKDFRDLCNAIELS